jgi:hypothetical protein
MSYAADAKTLRRDAVDDGVMRFSRRRRSQAAAAPQAELAA